MHWLLGLRSDDWPLLKPGALLNERYRVVDGPLQGGNGSVYFCQDLETRQRCVVKAYRPGSFYSSDGEREAKLAQVVNQLDPAGEYFVRYLSSFNYKRHFCMVLEQYGISLFQAQQIRRDRPLPTRAIAAILSRVVKALGILHSHGMIHTDIKLENILLPPDFRVETDFERVPINVKLIDLGSIASAGRWHRHLATTRFYRAPEIILGLRWGLECDIWSLGCLLVELFLGHIPFVAADEVVHLFLIQHMIGPFPQRMLDLATDTEIRSVFTSGFVDPRILADIKQEHAVSKPPLIELLGGEPLLCDLALKLLEPDPLERLPIDKILEHGFFDDL
jgi:dual-specificity kinase